jgi:hypothetical protein
VSSAPSLPEVLELAAGGYLGDSFRVRLDGDVLHYEHLRGGYEPHRTEEVVPEPEAWERFWRALEVIDPWSWNGEYALPPERTVMDGSHWNVRLQWLGQRIEASGDNCYPPYGDGPSTSPHWDLFCEAVERLVGGRPCA